MSTYDVVIVGGGPAGLSAATYSRLRGLLSVTFEAETFGGQLINLYPTKPVSNFPAQLEVASRELAKRLAEQASHFGAELLEQEGVDFVGRSDTEFVVRTAKREVRAKALILALGLGRFTPRTLGLQDEERYLGRGLVYKLPPRENIRAQRAVVVGGGDTALDTALALRRIVPDVTLVHRREVFSAYEFSQKQLAESDVRLLTNAEVVALAGEGALDHVVVSIEGRETLAVPADLLLVSIGQVPDLRGVKRWGIDLEDCHLPVNSAMETGMRGLFAAGDFAAYAGKVKMIATAVAEGSTAASSVERFLRSGGLGAAA